MRKSSMRNFFEELQFILIHISAWYALIRTGNRFYTIQYDQLGYYKLNSIHIPHDDMI